MKIFLRVLAFYLHVNSILCHIWTFFLKSCLSGAEFLMCIYVNMYNRISLVSLHLVMSAVPSLQLNSLQHFSSTTTPLCLILLSSQHLPFQRLPERRKESFSLLLDILLMQIGPLFIVVSAREDIFLKNVHISMNRVLFWHYNSPFEQQLVIFALKCPELQMWWLEDFASACVQSSC